MADDYVLTPVDHDPFAATLRARVAANTQAAMFGGQGGSLPDPVAISRPATLESYTPTLSERVGNVAQDAMAGLGASKGYAQGVGSAAQTLAAQTPMSAAYEAGRSGAAGDVAGAAINALGALPDGGASIAGLASHAIFAGPMARTADRAALETAQKMAAEGADKAAIWKDTGWFTGADGKWRFEIPDDRVHVPEGGRVVGKTGALDSVVEHPDAYDAYPFLKNLNASYGVASPETGAFTPHPMLKRAGEIEIGDSVYPERIAVHEMQHAVQRSEDFANGASPRMYTQQDDARLASDALAFRHDMAAVPGDLTPQQRAAAVVKSYHDMGAPDWLPSSEAQSIALDHDGNPDSDLKEIVSLYGLDRRTSPYSPIEMYKNSAGEVEARNVQARMNMTPEERRTTPPWQTQDVSDEQQIVRFRMGGPQMSDVTLTPVDHNPFTR